MPAAAISATALLSLIHRQPGIDLGAIESATQVHRRTLQRRLAELVASGEVVSQRFQRAVVFMPGNKHSVQEPAPAWGAPSEPYVRLSPAGEQIKAYVRRPIYGRKPVGYELGFLEAYHPNFTFYLPEKLREQLHLMGRSPVTQAPAGTFARGILDRLLIDLSWASSRLEGNTYNRLDTERLIGFGEAAEGKDVLETKMILNHKAAIQYLVEGVDHVGVDGPTIIALHALLSEQLLANPMACGALRRCIVEIGGSVYRPLGVPQSIEDIFSFVLGMAAEIADPFEQSFFLMVHLPYLQPFEDVNKRVSRLAANIPLIKANLCPLSFIDLPERAYVDGLLGVYELNRVELLSDVYLSAYERSCQQYVAVQKRMVMPDPFQMRYRAALAEVVRAIIRGGLRLNKASIRKLMPASVPREDHARFVALVEKEFESIHANNVVRFGLRALEFQAWSDGTRKATR